MNITKSCYDSQENSSLINYNPRRIGLIRKKKKEKVMCGFCCFQYDRFTQLVSLYMLVKPTDTRQIVSLRNILYFQH